MVPALFRAPETGWAYGLSGSVSFKTSFKNDPETRTSIIQALGIFTQRGQNVQVIDGVIFSPKEKYIYTWHISHSYFPDKFWGIGPETQNNWKERYTFEQFYFFPHVKKKIAKHLFAGVLFDYQNVFRLTYLSGGVYDTSSVIGKKPYVVSGVGASLAFDSRNSTFWPTKGFFAQSYYTQYDKLIGSTYNTSKWVTDMRYFKEVFKGHIIAFQLYSYNTFGQTPIRNLAALGGMGNLRGFYQGRYRDKNMTTLIAEYRAFLFWRISACAFGGIGNVYNNFSSFNYNDIKYTFGAGLRLTLLQKERLNLRLDYGYYDRYNRGFYFTAGEAF